MSTNKNPTVLMDGDLLRAVNGANIFIKIIARIAGRSFLDQAGEITAPAIGAQNDALTITLVVDDKQVEQATEIIETDNKRNSPGGRIQSYLDIGMPLGKAAQETPGEKFLLVHEGRELAERHGRQNMTALTSRLLERYRRYGGSADNSYVISRNGKKNISYSANLPEYVDLSIRRETWEKINELAGPDAEGYDSIMKRLIRMASGGTGKDE